VLIWAAGSGNSEAVAYLLQQGADINAQDQDGTTALMEAVDVREPEVVKVLVARGADVSLKNKSGKTARDIARGFRDHRCLNILEEIK